jgi:hypothetical protein
MKKSLVIFSVFSVILLASMNSGASATKGWMQSDHSSYIRHTAINPGNTKICGDHICKPFENSSIKSSQVFQNNSTKFVKQKHIDKASNKTISQVTKSFTDTKKE